MQETTRIVGTADNNTEAEKLQEIFKPKPNETEDELQIRMDDRLKDLQAKGHFLSGRHQINGNPIVLSERNKRKRIKKKLKAINKQRAKVT